MTAQFSSRLRQAETLPAIVKSTIKMKHILFSFLIFLTLTSFKRPGSATAQLTCKSESGRTLFTADIQDIDGGLERAELSIDGVKLNFHENDNSSIIFDSKTQVFTILLESKPNKDFSKHKFLKFWAIPSTFKTLVETHTQGKYQFRAKLYSTEPRKEKKELHTPVIEVECLLQYEI
ncbi:hypothetical protein C3K47_19165 [Solitalea longa]|uniref:Uncharacterized protein n=1 Tax=Solitalea longa TaxID=2079460 RepID=A0A2S4ZWC3_9SPHI|nr:hypothetical protein [Solitalea longa]POY34670.1 hypothetical protein C3K47_19165 [Solitalea longa]